MTIIAVQCFNRKKLLVQPQQILAVYKQVSKDAATKQNAMLKLVVCVLTLAAVCCAQEHFTCLQTDDVLHQQNP